MTPHLRSSLSRYQPQSRRPVDSVARQAWRDGRVLGVARDDPRLNDIDRLMIDRLAEKLFGLEGK